MTIYMSAHQEYISVIPKRTKFFDNYSGKTKSYYFIKELCEKHNISFSDDKILELHWRLQNNDFSVKVCKYCGIYETTFVSCYRKFREFCSTSCSAKHRDNTTRKGFNTEEGRQKARETILIKYGVSHQSHIPRVFENSQNNRYKTYSIYSPSGNEYRVQGYERFVIPELWQTYGEENIIASKQDIPKIKYSQTKLYYPDAYITSINRLIEVKSTYTIQASSLKTKMMACIDSGYDIKVALHDKGETKYFSYNDIF